MTLFYINVNALQLTQFSPNGFGREVTNAGSADSKGIEVTITSVIAKNLTLNLNYSLSDARFTNYFDTISMDGASEYRIIDYKNKRVPYVPSQIFNINVRYINKLTGSINLLSFIEWIAVNDIY